MLLPLLILGTVGFVVFAFVSVRSEKCGKGSHGADALPSAAKFVFGGGVPVGVAAVMTHLFLFVGGASTAQLNAGSPSRLHMWSTWTDLWPVLLFMTAASGSGALVWLVTCALNKTMRPSILAAVASFILSVLALFAVLSYFPSA